MTVPATARRAGPYNGNGSTTSFSFSFKTFAAGDLQVTRTSSVGVETVLVLNSDYSVTLNPDQDTNPGGTITYPISGTALATGEKLTIVGNLAYEQTTDLLGGGAFNARVIEDTFDRTVIQIQQLEERADRAMALPVSASGVSATLPAPEANKYLGWNGAATALVNRDGSDLVTAAAYGNWRTDVFNGTGAQVAFILTQDPGNVNNTDVAIGGVTQTPGVDYTVSGTTLTFASAPPAGTGNVVVRYGLAIPAGITDSNLVTFLQAGTGAVQRTTQSKLRDVVSVKDFGAVGNGVADDTLAIQAALDYCEANGFDLQGAPGTYKITSTLVIKCGGDLSAMAINVNATTVTPAIRVGPNMAAQYLFDVDLKLPFITNTAKVAPGWTGFTNSIGVEIANVYQSRILIPSVYNFGVGVTCGGYSVGCVHNVFTLGILFGNRIQLQLQAKDATGFVNENLFIGGRIEYSSSEGTAVAGTAYIQLRPYLGASNDPNNNVFLKPSVEGVEGEYQLSICGAFNKFINPRLETATNIRIQFYAETGQTTQSNVIDGGYRVVGTIVTNTGAGTITGNFWINNQKGGEARHYSGNGLNVANQTSNGITNPHIQGFTSSADVIAKDESATDWMYRLYADGMAFKAPSDLFPRVQIDGQNGYIYLTRGGAAVSNYIRAGSPAGTGFEFNGMFYPDADNTFDLGIVGRRMATVRATNFRPGSGSSIWTSGTGTPEGAVTAAVGSLFTRTDGGAGTTLYVKESGAGNTGWVAK